MDRSLLGSSAKEAEDYLRSVLATCTGFEIAVVTSAEPASRQRLRERLARAGAEIMVVPPDLEQVLAAPRVGQDVAGHRSFVLWVELGTEGEEPRWRELVAALNRSRQRLMDDYRYLWVVAGPASLQRIMAQQGQDLYSGAYKVPYVLDRSDAELRWLHLSDLQLGDELSRGPRQAGDVWRSLEGLFLPDLARTIDELGAAPDLVIVSGDLSETGRASQYQEVDRILDRVLDELERRGGRRPFLLAVPGNHDVRRPDDLVERWRFELLRRHDDDADRFARALREQLWEHKDASVLEPLFAAYAAWAERRVLAALRIDDLGMEPGVAYVRSVVRSHVPGDFSVVIEKDDLRLGILGLDTAWTSFDDAVGAGDVLLPLPQVEAALGPSGLSTWVNDVHACVVVTHHGPEWLSDAGRAVLETRLAGVVLLAAHLCGPRYVGDEQVEATSIVHRGYPLAAWGIAQKGQPSGYRLGRIGRDGRVESIARVLEPMPGPGTWRYVEAAAHRGQVVTEQVASALVPAAEGRESAAEIERYLEKLVARQRWISLMGFTAKVRMQLSLDDLYVSLDAAIGLEMGAKVSSLAEAEIVHDALRARGHATTLAEAFAAAERLGRRGLVLLGDPGSGKTTALRQMLLKLVGDGPASLGLPEGMVPVFLRLGELPPGSHGFARLLRRDLEALGVDDPASTADHLLQRGRRRLWLLDGLDEVADGVARVEVARRLEDLLAGAPEDRVLVTARFAGYGPHVLLTADFIELHLGPMNDAQVEAFVRRWYATVEAGTHDDPEQAQREAERHSNDLLSVLQQPGFTAIARVYELTRNPLLLTAICLVHRDRGRLPQARAQLYDEVIDLLLDRWRELNKKLPVTFSADDARKVLQPVALWMHEEEGRRQARIAELIDPVTKALDGAGLGHVEARRFLEVIRDESGLLTGWGLDRLGFMHLAFQEYLAAQQLRNEGLKRPTVLIALARRFGEGWWREVILSVVALRNPSVFDELMRAVVRQPEFPHWATTDMMQLCLREASEASPAPFEEVLRARDSDVSVEHQLAAAAVLLREFPHVLESLAHYLAQHPSIEVRTWWATLVDLRRAPPRIITTRGGVELVRIPGGSFLMGSAADDEWAFADEQPRHEVSLESFYIARTPVTNAQYQEFLRSSPARREPAYWSDRRFNQADQPVVGLSWFDAVAYCEWAGLLLPTEAQWEYACRAGTTTRYWSGDGEADLAQAGWYGANSGGRLHSVAEKAASPWGLHDAHGNVWEWCRDAAHAPYHLSPRAGDGLRKEPVGDVDRIMRGGGWSYDARFARSACRDKSSPSQCVHVLGFRPVQQHP